MDAPAAKTLLAVLLALKNLEAPLSSAEQSDFKKLGQQLYLRPKSWESVAERLVTVIKTNVPLNQLYQDAKAQLNTGDGNISPNLLPTKAELEQVISADKISVPVTRSGFDRTVKPDRQSHEVVNIAVVILNTDNPDETAKKLIK